MPRVGAVGRQARRDRRLLFAPSGRTRIFRDERQPQGGAREFGSHRAHRGRRRMGRADGAGPGTRALGRAGGIRIEGGGARLVRRGAEGGSFSRPGCDPRLAAETRIANSGNGGAALRRAEMKTMAQWVSSWGRKSIAVTALLVLFAPPIAAAAEKLRVGRA